MRIKERLRDLLHAKESPERVAFSFAFGVFIGISPVLGLHTIIAVLVAFLFRLNKIATLTGMLITNPWTLIPIYSFCTWVGMRACGMDSTTYAIDWSAVTYKDGFKELHSMLLPYTVGTLLVGTICGLASYFILREVIVRARRRRKKSEESAELAGEVRQDAAPEQDKT